MASKDLISMTNLESGVKVTVAAKPSKYGLTYAVKVLDTDAGLEVGTKIFNKLDTAAAYAGMCVK